MRFNLRTSQFFSHLSMRKKVVLVSTLSLFLVAIISFSVLFKMGKLGTKADSAPKTVTISGFVKDGLTNQPLLSTTVNLGYKDGDIITTTTDANGFYQISITVDPAIVQQNSVAIQFEKSDYFSGDSNYVTKSVSLSDPSTVTLNQDFTLAPKSILPQPSPQKPALCDNLTTIAEVINGVTFCTNDVDKFTALHSQIVENAKQAIMVRNQAGIVNLPKIFLDKGDSQLMKSNNAAGLYYPKGLISSKPEIHVSYDALFSTETITHEIGHHVDWIHGYERDLIRKRDIFSNAVCLPVSPGAMFEHCFSSNFDDFREATSTVGWDSSTRDSYSNKNDQEMYAEIFENQFNAKNNFVSREQFKYVITNYSLASIRFDFTAISTIDTTFDSSKGPRSWTQNCWMYLYKFVAKQSNLQEYFPGTVKRWGRFDVLKGQYMETGVVSIRVIDHSYYYPMGNTMVYTGSNSQNTKNGATRVFKPNLTIDPKTGLKKGGFFSDGTGDLFDTTGTVVLMIVPIGGSQTIDIPNPPTYYKGAVFFPVKKNIVKGANEVIDLNYNRYIVGPFSYTDANAMGHASHTAVIGATGVINPSDTYYALGSNKVRTVYPIVKNPTARYPDIGTVNGKVDALDGNLDFIIGGDITKRVDETYTFGTTKVANGGVVKAPSIINYNNPVSDIGCNTSNMMYNFVLTLTKRYNACVYSSTN